MYEEHTWESTLEIGFRFDFYVDPIVTAGKTKTKLHLPGRMAVTIARPFLLLTLEHSELMHTWGKVRTGTLVTFEGQC